MNNHIITYFINMQSFFNQAKNMRIVMLMLFASLSFNLSAQTITVTGNVIDSTGEPVIGASEIGRASCRERVSSPV